MHEPFKRRIPVSHSPLGLADMSLTSFGSQMFWRLISRVQVLKVRILDVGSEPLLLKERLQVCEFP